MVVFHLKIENNTLCYCNEQKYHPVSKSSYRVSVGLKKSQFILAQIKVLNL